MHATWRRNAETSSSVISSSGRDEMLVSEKIHLKRKKHRCKKNFHFVVTVFKIGRGNIVLVRVVGVA